VLFLSSSECKITDYIVTVTTSNVMFGGTDAKVYVHLYGEHGETGDIHLAKPEGGKNPFEQGRVDVFHVKGANWLGDLQKLRVWHDSTGRCILSVC
jgi:hypothetical protein